jgi:iron complex outermembrane receptor protein
MSKVNFLKGVLLTCAATVALDTSSLAQTTAAPQTGTSANGAEAIESVTVTARRRSEQLLQTPVSVSAFDSKELARRHVDDISDIAAATPSLTFEGTAGNSGDARIFLRGVGNGNPGDFQDPGVGIYIDGAYYGRASGAFLDNVDMQQVEVLRGPQGTLFGRNTIGGAISVTTAKPDATDFFGTADMQYGNYNDVRPRLMVNVPLVDDQLAFRGAVVYEHNDGYSYNAYTDTRTDNINKFGLSGALRYTPTSRLTIDLDYMKVEDNSYGRAFSCNIVGTAPLQGTVDFLYNTNYINDCNKNSSAHPYTYYSDLNPEAREHTESAVGTVNYDFGGILGLDDLSSKVIGAYENEKPKRVIDFDGTDLNIIDSIDYDREEEASSAEVQFTGNGIGNRLNFVVGGYFSHEDTPSGYVYTDVLPVLDPVLDNPGAIGACYAGITAACSNDIYQKFDLNNSSRAVYGQFTFDITDIFSITGGTRYTSETKALSLVKYPVFQSQPSTQEGPFTADGYFTHDFSNMSPMGTLQAKAPSAWLDGSIFDEAMTYFTFSEGFKSGGWNANGNNNTSSPGNVDTVDLFAPEKVKNYELGTKFSAFDHRLELSADVYYMDYNNIQVANIEFINGTIASVINNAARARVQGVDLEGVALLTETLRADFSWSVTDGKYLSFPSYSESGQPVNLSYEPFFFVYPWKISIGLENRFEMDNGMAITPRVEIDPQGPRYLASSEDPAAIAAGRQPSITLVNADIRADITPTLSLDVYAKNLSNEKYINDALDLSSTLGNVLTYYAPPLLFGIKLEKKF